MKRWMTWRQRAAVYGLLGALLAADVAVAATLVHTGTTVGTSAVAIDTTPSHVFVKVWNNCTQTVYVGFSSGISASNGIPLFPGAWIEFDVDAAAGNRLFGVVSAGTCDVRTLEKKQ